MRVLVIFFIFTCFCLLGGYKAAGTGNHCVKAFCVPVENGIKTQGGYLKGVQENTLLSNPRDLPAENEFPVLAEADDDQEDINPKKSASLTGSFSTHFFASVFHPSGTGLASNLFFPEHPSNTSSCKYILQRVLRI